MHTLSAEAWVTNMMAGGLNDGFGKYMDFSYLSVVFAIRHFWVIALSVYQIISLQDFELWYLNTLTSFWRMLQETSLQCSHSHAEDINAKLFQVILNHFDRKIAGKIGHKSLCWFPSTHVDTPLHSTQRRKHGNLPLACSSKWMATCRYGKPHKLSR